MAANDAAMPPDVAAVFHRVFAGVSVRETTMTKKRFSRLRQGLRKAFSLQSPHGPLTDDDRQWIRKLARSIVQRDWAVLWIYALAAYRPLGSLTSQAMVFLRPFHEPMSWMLYLVKPLLNRLVDVNLLSGQEQYDRLTAILDRREGVEAMLEAIEEEQELYKKPLL